jgi:sensor histidine kinase YesM
MLGVFFVLLWPVFNLLFVATIFTRFGVMDQAPMFAIAVRFFSSFAAVFVIVALLEARFPRALAEERFFPQLFVHVGVFFVLIFLTLPSFEKPVVENVPQLNVVPAVLLLLEITLYVAVKTFLVQREQHFNTQLNLRQARINLLRSQSNPHFLFNTLNLLASEIKRDPDTAREIVYDLADLLRESMKAADAEFITVREEVRLATLYLGLQQKRFPDRLEFDVQVAADCEAIPIPALLLQPIVENAVKHVVANATDVTTVLVDVRLVGNELVLKVKDNGPRVDHGAVQRGSGFRIVSETLSSHYPGRGRMTFTSSNAGGEVIVRLPQVASDHRVTA